MATDSFLEREGARIAYRVEGDGMPIGYAHGVLLSRAAVRRMELFDFDTLGAGRRLLTYDQRGHGASTGRPVAADYRFDTAAGDLLALLENVAEEPADIAGSSWGAAAALHAALVAPQRFRRLVLIIPPVAWETGEHRARHWYAENAATIERIGGAAWRAEYAARPPLPIFADYPRAGFTPDIDDALLPAALRGIGESDLPAPETLGALHIPTLVLTWTTDPLHPVDTAERLHAALPDAELHVASTVAEIGTWTHRVGRFFAG